MSAQGAAILTEVSESFDAWVSRGRSLCDAGKRLQWEMGDWWRSGQHAYGDRAKAAAQGIFGVEYGSLKNIASVAGTFEKSRRRDLSFSHHAEVAALEPKKADALLDMAERNGLSKRELRAEVVKQKEASRPQAVKETKPVTKILPRPAAKPSKKTEATDPAARITELESALALITDERDEAMDTCRALAVELEAYEKASEGVEAAAKEIQLLNDKLRVAHSRCDQMMVTDRELKKQIESQSRQIKALNKKLGTSK